MGLKVYFRDILTSNNCIRFYCHIINIISREMEDLDLALSGLEKVHKVVNDAKPQPVIVEPKRIPGPIFKGDSYNRQKRGEVYWVKDPKPIKPGIPIGRPGNILGLTDAL